MDTFTLAFLAFVILPCFVFLVVTSWRDYLTRYFTRWPYYSGRPVYNGRLYFACVRVAIALLSECDYWTDNAAESDADPMNAHVGYYPVVDATYLIVEWYGLRFRIYLPTEVIEDIGHVASNLDHGYPWDTYTDDADMSYYYGRYYR